MVPRAPLLFLVLQLHVKLGTHMTCTVNDGRLPRSFVSRTEDGGGCGVAMMQAAVGQASHFNWFSLYPVCSEMYIFPFYILTSLKLKCGLKGMVSFPPPPAVLKTPVCLITGPPKISGKRTVLPTHEEARARTERDWTHTDSQSFLSKH